MPRLTTAAWLAARSEWEADPALSYQSIATKLGVSLPAVTQHAQKNNWRKASAPVAREELAQAVADTIAHVAGRTELLDATDAALDLSVASRVAVINKHRSDWSEHRRLYTHEAMASDPVCAKRAKMAAEAIALRQRGEAIAFGLVSFTGSDTGAPLAEVVEDATKPKAAWELMIESYTTTGRAPAAAHTPTHELPQPLEDENEPQQPRQPRRLGHSEPQEGPSEPESSPSERPNPFGPSKRPKLTEATTVLDVTYRS